MTSHGTWLALALALTLSTLAHAAPATPAAPPADLVRADHPDALPPAPDGRLWHNSFVRFGFLFDTGSNSSLDYSGSGIRCYQTLTFNPQLHVTRALRLGLRLGLAYALHRSDNYAGGEAVVPELDLEHSAGPAVYPTRPGTGHVSDLHLDADYAPRFLLLPWGGIRLVPGVRLVVPLSSPSRGESLLLGLAPALTVMRAVRLLEGPALRYLDLGYTFRAYKYFRESETVAISPYRGGARNTSWRLNHALFLHLHVAYSIELGFGLQFLNDRLYAVPQESTSVTGLGDVGSVNERNTWLWSLELRYAPWRWLFVSAGVTQRRDPTLDPVDGETTYGYLNLALAMDRAFIPALW